MFSLDSNSASGGSSSSSSSSDLLHQLTEHQNNMEIIGNSTPANIQTEFFCKWILYEEILGSRVRIWDISILVPNVLFLLFLVFRFNRARLKLRATSSPIFFTFYALVAVNAVISVIRCVVSMTVNAAVPAGSMADKVLWVAVRFFLLSTEMSFLIFGLAFGHLDSKTSIRRVLLVTSFIALAYSCTQGALEIVTPDETFQVVDKQYYIFGHGGMLFWFVSSILFSLIYWTVFMLPWTRLRDRLALPTKRSFYWYASFLALLNLSQAVGSGMLYYGESCGLCVVDVTTYIYFTIFTPLVYRTFLADFFSVAQPSIMFSYKAQVDDVVEDDNVSLPHQLSCSSLKTDSDYIYQNNYLYDSTQFDASNVNPLYVHSLQSPDSLNGGHHGGSGAGGGFNCGFNGGGSSVGSVGMPSSSFGGNTGGTGGTGGGGGRSGSRMTMEGEEEGSIGSVGSINSSPPAHSHPQHPHQHYNNNTSTSSAATTRQGGPFPPGGGVGGTMVTQQQHRRSSSTSSAATPLNIGGGGGSSLEQQQSQPPGSGFGGSYHQIRSSYHHQVPPLQKEQRHSYNTANSPS